LLERIGCSGRTRDQLAAPLRALESRETIHIDEKQLIGVLVAILSSIQTVFVR